MRCKDVQDLIMTDYIDNEATPPVRRQIEDHCASCPGCGAVLRSVQSLSAPLRNTAPVMPPAALWERIQVSVSEPARPAGLLHALLGRWQLWVPAVSLAAAAAVIVALFVFEKPAASGSKSADLAQEEYTALLTYVTGEGDKSFNGGYSEFGTTVEEYLL